MQDFRFKKNSTKEKMGAKEIQLPKNVPWPSFEEIKIYSSVNSFLLDLKKVENIINNKEII